jgi:hypothetical protein
MSTDGFPSGDGTHPHRSRARQAPLGSPASGRTPPTGGSDPRVREPLAWDSRRRTTPCRSHRRPAQLSTQPALLSVCVAGCHLNERNAGPTLVAHAKNIPRSGSQSYIRKVTDLPDTLDLARNHAARRHAEAVDIGDLLCVVADARRGRLARRAPDIPLGADLRAAVELGLAVARALDAHDLRLQHFLAGRADHDAELARARREAADDRAKLLPTLRVRKANTACRRNLISARGGRGPKGRSCDACLPRVGLPLPP